jgi:hypothetical protein
LDQNYLVPFSCGGALDAPSACSGVRRRRLTQLSIGKVKVIGLHQHFLEVGIMPEGISNESYSETRGKCISW